MNSKDDNNGQFPQYTIFEFLSRSSNEQQRPAPRESNLIQFRRSTPKSSINSTTEQNSINSAVDYARSLDW